MSEGAILDPYDFDNIEGDLTHRVKMLEQQPKVQPAFYYQAVPYRSSVSPNATWYAGHTNATLGGAGGIPWAIPLPVVGMTAAYCQVNWTTDAATTGQIQLTANSGSNLTSAVTLGAGSSGTVTFLWLHGLTLWRRAINFDLWARRATGAGTVYVQCPTFALVDSIGATTTGI